MKWAEAKTRLSFVTATLNSLWAGTPPSFQQHGVDGRARQVRGGAGVEGVGLVPELAVERSGSIPSRGGPYPPGVEHAARAACSTPGGYGPPRDGMLPLRSTASSGTRPT